MSVTALEISLKSVPFLQLLGVRVANAEQGRVALSLPYRRENANHHGAVHSAAVFALGELAAAVAVATHPRLSGVPHVVKCTKVKYEAQSMRDLVAKAEVPETLAADVERTLSGTGKATAEIDVAVADETGSEVARLITLFAFER